MKTSKRRNMILIVILVICLGIFSYITAKTELVIRAGLWDAFQSTYELEEGEVLYTATFFDKNGIAPICIKNVEFMDRKTGKATETEGYLCFTERITQGWYPPGFGIEQKSFFDEFGENMIPKEDGKWMNEDFVAIEIKDGDEVTDTDCKITYAVWGVFEKTITGTSREK